MRVELRDGQWAELRERITHGTDKELKRAWRRGKDDPLQRFDFDTALVRAFLRDWAVRDPDGNPIPPTDGDAIDRAPDDVVDVLVKEAARAWTGATVPNGLTPPSSDGGSSATP